ncbi:T9SS type A sorting domain-containing protein [Aureispira anguillae]|uniref:Secretion system C-terminal sorting domain-containing protein n=1 Tax=Aureispira anguillae TaxID=2864201 RepID=A0A915VMS7_9BACT|nr:T9SS type A sorting domain-containing protein [Aureispira anguillae]BDS09669.1 hypothetical protein AsAng_0003730 [Aureispira anguillae]
MKNYTNLFFLGLLTILFTASCSNQQNQEVSELEIESASVTRAAQTQEQVLQVNFEGKMITLETSDIVATAQLMNAEDADAATVMSINESLMGAEKEAQLLDVNFTMSDEPVENGMFIFGIETEDAKNLTIEMFDEEGFAMVANNKFEINQGNNYKALNVKSLDNGTYNFRLKDDAGKELNRQVIVQTAE